MMARAMSLRDPHTGPVTSVTCDLLRQRRKSIARDAPESRVCCQ